jgi:hypothetical protein
MLSNVRSDPIPIQQTSPTRANAYNEYSLKQNFFDPTKSSPPNEFMIKLRMRIHKHYDDNVEHNLVAK